jgi:hypothetical protein
MIVDSEPADDCLRLHRKRGHLGGGLCNEGGGGDYVTLVRGEGEPSVEAKLPVNGVRESCRVGNAFDFRVSGGGGGQVVNM